MPEKKRKADFWENVTMAKKKREPVPILWIKKGDSLKTIYAKARQAFSAADLQRFTVVEKGIPVAEVIAELEKLDRQDKQRGKGKPRNARKRHRAI